MNNMKSETWQETQDSKYLEVFVFELALGFGSPNRVLMGVFVLGLWGISKDLLQGRAKESILYVCSLH
jgi:hypothetical protein